MGRLALSGLAQSPKEKPLSPRKIKLWSPRSHSGPPLCLRSTIYDSRRTSTAAYDLRARLPEELPPPPSRNRKMPPMILAINSTTATTTPTVSKRPTATIPSKTHKGHQRRSRRITLPFKESHGFPGPLVERVSRDSGGGGGLPSISRTSASMVSGTALSFSDLSCGAI